MTDFLKEREALEELIVSEGWKIFCQKVALEYQGHGYFQKMQTALEKGSKEARVLNETAKGVINLANWPKYRIGELKAVKE